MLHMLGGVASGEKAVVCWRAMTMVFIGVEKKEMGDELKGGEWMDVPLVD
jgi:hypothetical protein